MGCFNGRMFFLCYWFCALLLLTYNRQGCIVYERRLGPITRTVRYASRYYLCLFAKEAAPDTNCSYDWNWYAPMWWNCRSEYDDLHLIILLTLRFVFCKTFDVFDFKNRFSFGKYDLEQERGSIHIFWRRIISVVLWSEFMFDLKCVAKCSTGGTETIFEMQYFCWLATSSLCFYGNKKLNRFNLLPVAFRLAGRLARCSLNPLVSEIGTSSRADESHYVYVCVATIVCRWGSGWPGRLEYL